MRISHLIDPELAEMYAAMPGGNITIENLAQQRQGLSDLVSGDPDLPYETRTIPGPASGPEVPVLLYNLKDGGQPRPAIFYIHGGGMVMGEAAMAGRSFSGLVPEIDFVGLSVEYRLAPESPFPGPQEECFAALAWTFDHAEELGIDPARIVILGMSAGGGLTASLAQMARDRGLPPLAGQILECPMLDYRTGGPDSLWPRWHGDDMVWSPQGSQFGWKSLQGDYQPEDERKGWFSAALADDLSGLAPAYINVGILDMLAPEAMDYARRLAEADVPVELHVYPGAYHGFELAAQSQVARKAHRDLAEAIGRMLAA